MRDQQQQQQQAEYHSDEKEEKEEEEEETLRHYNMMSAAMIRTTTTTRPSSSSSSPSVVASSSSSISGTSNNSISPSPSRSNGCNSPSSSKNNSGSSSTTTAKSSSTSEYHHPHHQHHHQSTRGGGPRQRGGGGRAARAKAQQRRVPSDLYDSATPSSKKRATLIKRRRRVRHDKQQKTTTTRRLWLGGTVLLMGLVVVILNVFYFVDFVEHIHNRLMRNNDSAAAAADAAALESKHAKIDKILQSLMTPSSSTVKKEKQQSPQEESSAITTRTSEEEEKEEKENHDDNYYDLLYDDKGPILDLLRDAGIYINDLDDNTLAQLPTWSQVTDLYGSEPIIHGLHDGVCEEFQHPLSGDDDPAEHFVSTAGTMNTGTNLLAELLIHNCALPQRQKRHGPLARGVRWQVPWGKYTPVGDEQFRRSHKAGNELNIDASQVFAAVTIRDPATWMPSMCRHAYAMHWAHNGRHDEAGTAIGPPSLHCPNLVPNEVDIRGDASLAGQESIPVSVEYPEFTTHHDSMLHHYMEWYQAYLEAKWPRLIVRFEDVIFHPRKVTQAVCECAGGKLSPTGRPKDMKDKSTGKPKDFIYVVNSAKKGSAHGKSPTGYVQSIIKYGHGTSRWQNMTQDDLNFVLEYMDPHLMELFGYQMPPVPQPQPQQATDADDERQIE